MRGNNLFCNGVDLYYKFHEINLNRSESYINSRKWLKNKKATINPKNNDDKCFQYAVAVALNYQNIKKSRKNIKNQAFH